MSRKGIPNFSSETKANMLRDYRSSTPLKVLRVKYNVGENYIRLLAKKQGLPSRNKYLPEWQRQAIADAYGAGEKAEAISAEFDVCLPHVREIAKAFGHPPRPTRRPSKKEMRAYG